MMHVRYNNNTHAMLEVNACWDPQFGPMQEGLYYESLWTCMLCKSTSRTPTMIVCKVHCKGHSKDTLGRKGCVC